jgi:PAS domain S-box-containing protein
VLVYKLPSWYTNRMVQADALPPQRTEPSRSNGDPALEQHLQRVESYMQSCGILTYPREASALRSELVAFLQRHSPQAVDEWMKLIGPAFSIPESQWPEVRSWMHDALSRWFRHIEDPSDVETYVYLRTHTRRGFISHFSASRFLSGQMKLQCIFQDYLRDAYRDDAGKREELLALFTQEFNERLLHTTDFFVEGREEDLREQEAGYRQATDNAPAAIFKVDRDFGTILGASKVAERLVGLTSDQMIGMRVWDLMPPDERQRVMRVLEETRRRRHSHREDMHLQRRDGELVPVFFNAGLIEYGEQHFYQVICVDISERKRLESQLIQSEKMAAIGQLAAGIAHEIRNPLGIIANALYDLGELVDQENPDVKEDLRIATEEMGRVQDIINNLLEFSRESRAEVEVVDINDLLRKTLQLMAKSLQNSGVRVVTEFGGLGTCLANQNALRQIFLNLITNAVQAMPSGGTLRVRSERLPDNRVLLEFTDTGVGIPPEHLTDIFNPFFSTKEPGEGTGLGLSVVHSVVKRYRGTIRVQSQVNRGTTFTIELPCPCEEGSAPFRVAAS